jgi:hypothetical protein
MNKKILEIAEEVRKELIEIYDSPKAVCLEASRMLKKELKKNGFESIIVQGTFTIDDPLEFDEFDDFDEDEDNENCNHYIYDPLHYWIEINEEILDITADQFKEQVLDDIEEITFGKYSENTRYNAINKDWQ